MHGTAEGPAWGTVAPREKPPPLRTRYGGAVVALVVEADRAFAAALAAALTRNGMRVETACDALEALYAPEHEPPDLIVLDLDAPAAPAPVVSGHRFARLLRPDLVTGALPLLVLASLSFQEAAETLRGGADAFLEKPVGAAAVAAHARQLVEWGGAGHGARHLAGGPDGRTPTATRVETWLQAQAAEARRSAGGGAPAELEAPEEVAAGRRARRDAEAERGLDRAWGRLQSLRSAAAAAGEQAADAAPPAVPACLYRRALEDVQAACAAPEAELEPLGPPTPRQRFAR